MAWETFTTLVLKSSDRFNLYPTMLKLILLLKRNPAGHAYIVKQPSPLYVLHFECPDWSNAQQSSTGLAIPSHNSSTHLPPPHHYDQANSSYKNNKTSTHEPQSSVLNSKPRLNKYHHKAHAIYPVAIFNTPFRSHDLLNFKKAMPHAGHEIQGNQATSTQASPNNVKIKRANKGVKADLLKLQT